jgi:hypothetical protein
MPSARRRDPAELAVSLAQCLAGARNRVALQRRDDALHGRGFIGLLLRRFFVLRRLFGMFHFFGALAFCGFSLR